MRAVHRTHGIIEAWAKRARAGRNLRAGAILVLTMLLTLGSTVVALAAPNADTPDGVSLFLPLLSQGGVGAQTGDGEVDAATYIAGIRLFKYEDKDGDGTQDSGENGLEGWKFCLYKTNGDPYPNSSSQKCATTDSTGAATFIDLLAGNYKVCETLKSGWTNTDPGGSSACKTVTAVAGVGYTGSDPLTLTIPSTSDSYKIDFQGVSSNGLTWSYKVNEVSGKNLSHWVLGLCPAAVSAITSYAPTAGQNNVSSTAVGADPTTGVTGIKWNTTDAFTSFTFSVTFNQVFLQGKTTVAVKTGSGYKTGSVPGPECSTIYKFGNKQNSNAKVSVFKYEDKNGDGDKDSGEGGLQNWQFCLFKTDGTAYPNAATQKCVTTDSGGSASFTGIPAGNYKVCETLQAGWTNTDPGGASACKSVTAVVPVTSAQIDPATVDTGSTVYKFGNKQTTVKGSLKVTKSVSWNGWPSDSTTFSICIKGPSYPNGSETGACKSFSAGQQQTWADLLPGSYEVKETNPDANNWTVSGEGSVTVTGGQTATKTITNTRKMNDVQVSKTATTVYTRTNTVVWDLTKTVKPATTHLFEGESGVLTYTVMITPTATPADSGHKVSGSIVITNPGPAKTLIASLPLDVVAGNYPATVSCPGVTFPKELASGAKITCTYVRNLPSAISGTNVVTVTLSNNNKFKANAAVTFGAPSKTITVGSPVSVKDAYTIKGASSQETLGSNISSTWSKTYTRGVTCDSKLSYVGGVADFDADNTATIVGTSISDSAHADIFCYRPSVSKTVAPTTVLTYSWAIDKAVTPAHTDLFEGDATTLNYTVKVTRTLASQSYRLTGAITIVNPNPVKALTLTGIRDKLSSGQVLAVTCAGGNSVPAGSSAQCTYGGDLSSGAAVNNTATITAFTGLAYSSAAVPVDFSKATTTEVLASVNVNDTQPSSTAPWVFNGSGSQQYSYKVTCDDNAFNGKNSYTIPVDNTATIVQTQQSDSASASVTCWRLNVSKDASPSYTQPYQWTIDKTVSTNFIELVPGESEDAEYAVKVTKTAAAPTNLLVTGNVVVQNPAPIAAPLASVTDKLGDANVALNCGVDLSQGYNLAANSSLNCTYSHVPGSTANATNTATATLTNKTSFSGSAAVDFTNATVTELLPEINVTDTNVPGTQWTFSESGEERYSLTFDCEGAVYNQNNTSTATVPNTATIVETSAKDTAEVTRVCRVGDLTVIKAVNWNESQPDEEQGFEICIKGPSFPEGNEEGACQIAGFNGGALNWTDLIPGNYTVTETNPGGDWTVSGSGAVVGVPGGGSGELTITNKFKTTEPLGALGDFVWVDTNKNGVQDDGEPPVKDVTVKLLQPGSNGQCDAGDAMLATTITDENGFYLFDDLVGGDYCVLFVLPLGYEFTLLKQGSNPAKDSDANPTTGLTVKITLPNGDRDMTWDAGVVLLPKLGALGDFVWMDSNRNGVQDGDEPPIKGVTVKLLQPGANGQCDANDAMLAQTTTDDDGRYLFDNLPGGDYCVLFVLPNGFTFTTSNQGGDAAKDSDANQQTGLTVKITLPNGDRDMTWDAGLVADHMLTITAQSVCRNDTPYISFNVKPVGFTPVDPERAVKLTWQTLAGRNAQALSNLPLDGSKLLLLWPGMVLDSEGNPIDWPGWDQDEHGNWYQVATDLRPQIRIVIEVNPTAAVVVNYPPAEPTCSAAPDISALGNLVWLDKNQDGVQSDDEDGVPGVTVKLLKPGENGQCDVTDEVIMTTTTDSEGHYLFDGLAPGDYCVLFVAPKGYDFTQFEQGNDLEVDSNGDQQTGLTGKITLPVGITDLSWDTGLFLTNPTGLDPDDQPVKPVQLFLPSLNR